MIAHRGKFRQKPPARKVVFLSLVSLDSSHHPQMEAPVKHSPDVDELGREDHHNLETKNDNDNDEMPPLVADNVDGKSILPAQSPFLIWFFVQVTTMGGGVSLDTI
jgi:hypothetical protein